MLTPITKVMVLLLLHLLLQIVTLCNSIPLYTNSRWIVDQSGNRVKLTCVNWVSHLDPMLPEGLDKKPVNYIAGMISKTGFNCVRFTWPTFMFTRSEYGDLTVSQSLDKFKLEGAKVGFAKNNPDLFSMTVRAVHKAVVDELGRNKVMVVLDNHISIPRWCCSGRDGNGFFGDEYFNPKEWLQGLTTVAGTYKDHPTVIGMSLRNELRGDRQNMGDWHNFMAQGATAVHRASPDFLVIVSGLNYDNNLYFLRTEPLAVGNLDNKLVYEAHWYAFGQSAQEWTSKTNILCRDVAQRARNNYLFLTENRIQFPIFLSEFGIDQRGTNEADNRYISCLLATMADYDIDWALWTFQGSYMLRRGIIDMEETYGVMNKNWDTPRNPTFLSSLEMIRRMNKVPGATGTPYYRLFHPQTGQCAVASGDHISLDRCDAGSLWESNGDGDTIKLAKSSSCLVAAGDSMPARLVPDCDSIGSKWKVLSASSLYLAAEDGQGKHLCLAKDGSGAEILTGKCLCLNDDLSDFPTCSNNPQVQWFKLVPTYTG